MATLESYQLTHPELLSENDLRDVLGNCCIEMSVYQNLCKDELVEIYKRIAMPLPQRKQKNSKESDEAKENHRKPERNRTSGGDDQCGTSTSSDEGPSNSRDDAQTGRLKLPVGDSSPQKIRLSNTTKTAIECNGVNKRKDDKDGDSKDSPSKKRQKITWP